MILAVGTTNPGKLMAVDLLRPKWRLLQMCKDIFGKAVDSGVRAQPLSLDETVTGAENRARAALEGSSISTLGMGIESGIMTAKFKLMDVCACVIFDGKRSVVGLSGAWELPAEISPLVLTHGMTLTQACKTIGMTDDDRIGENGGALSLVTAGRLTRIDYTMQAVEMALASWGDV